MNLTDCLSALGGDYAALMGRMMSEDRIKKFLKMFCEDTSYNELCIAMEGADYETAFRAAHTLKGVCFNLGLDNLGKAASDITEALRGCINNGADELLPAVVSEYELAVEMINILE